MSQLADLAFLGVIQLLSVWHLQIFLIEFHSCFEGALFSLLDLGVALDALSVNSLYCGRNGLTKSPRTAKPWLQPGQYALRYPGANFPPPRTSSAIACFSGGNCASTSQLLNKIGAFDSALYFCADQNQPFIRCINSKSWYTNLKIRRNIETRWVA